MRQRALDARLAGADVDQGLAQAPTEPGSRTENQEAAPTLHDVEPREHFRDDAASSSLWGRRIDASLEFAAMAVELYRGDLVLFNARDGAIPYYAAHYLSGHEPGLDLRLISLRPLDHPEISAYLAQQSVGDAILEAGRRIVFTDVSMGQARTFHRLRVEIAPRLRGQVIAHVMMAWNEDHAPTLRTALRHLIDDAPMLDPWTAITRADKLWEFSIEFGVNPVKDYAKEGDRWVPMATAASADQKRLAREWKEHMRYAIDKPASRDHYARMGALWREARAEVRSGDHARLFDWLDAQFDRRPDLAEPLVRDVLAVVIRNHMHLYRSDSAIHFETLRGELTRPTGRSLRETLRTIRLQLGRR